MPVLKRRNIMGFVILLAVAAAGLFWYFRPAARPKNVILISIDTLRADHLGIYGYPRNTSPYLGRLARRSTVFTNAITPRPQTTPAMASVLTGLSWRQTKVRGLYDRLDERFETLAELLRDQGFQTAAFIGNWVLKAENSALHQGFDVYDETMKDEDLHRVGKFERKAPALTAAADNWLKDHYQKPFFLWLHYQDPHGPYIPPAEFRDLFKSSEPDFVSRFLVPGYQRLPMKDNASYVDANIYRDLYDGEIRFVDQSIGELLDKLTGWGLMKNTVIMVIADHGEGMGEHNYYFNHGHNVYEPNFRVPLIVYSPGLGYYHSVAQQVTLMDVTPTVLDILGYDIPALMEGRSFKSLLARGFSRYRNSPAYIESENDIRDVRTEAWKYVERPRRTAELFSLTNDPGELVNVVDQYPEKAEELAFFLQQWRQEDMSSTSRPLEDKGLDTQDIEAMRSLGYMQ